MGWVRNLDGGNSDMFCVYLCTGTKEDYNR